MTLTNPYEGAGGAWLRGNLHTHTTCSDGRLTPAEVVDHYAAAGYDFLALTDHDTHCPLPDDDRLVLIPGVEVSRGGPHLNAVGLAKVYDTSRPRGGIVAEIMADGALCFLNHPNWLADFNHWPHAMLFAVGPYHGIEIFNSVIDFHPGDAHALDRWDMLLSAGRRVWGYANDDFHDRPHGPRGWNMVCAERDPAAIVAALKAGRFYASTGVVIEQLALDGTTLSVTAPAAAEIRFVTLHGLVAQLGSGPSASYELTGGEGYVRVECWGAGRQAAWTNPVFIEEA